MNNASKESIVAYMVAMVECGRSEDAIMQDVQQMYNLSDSDMFAYASMAFGG